MSLEGGEIRIVEKPTHRCRRARSAETGEPTPLKYSIVVGMLQGAHLTLRWCHRGGAAGAHVCSRRQVLRAHPPCG